MSPVVVAVACAGYVLIVAAGVAVAAGAQAANKPANTTNTHKIILDFDIISLLGKSPIGLYGSSFTPDR
jgi:hypothetical protein